jgi:hypothetical protein
MQRESKKSGLTLMRPEIIALYNGMRRRQRAGRSCTSAVIGIIACALIATGCLYNRTRLTDISQQARVIENRQYRVLGVSEGTSSCFNLLWFIPVTPRTNYEKAVNDAVAGMRGDNIIEVRTWIERQVWIVGLVEILHVRGTVIQYEK